VITCFYRDLRREETGIGPMRGDVERGMFQPCSVNRLDRVDNADEQ